MAHPSFETSAAWRTRAYWLEQAGPYEPAEPLRGDLHVDVAIVGGGYTGLWAAHFLKAADPSLDIALLEQEVVGYGASGRNGGFAMTVVDYSLHHLLTHYGRERARAAHNAIARSVVEIGEFADKHGMDCEYELTGFLAVAASPGQVSRVRLDLQAAERLGLADEWTYLDRAAVREQVDSPVFECGAFERTCALLQPAKLAFGIRAAIADSGVRIFERTPVAAIEPGSTIVLRTPEGRVRCEQAVLAANAWSHRLPQVGRRALPLYTYILLTEPLSDAQRDRIGWRNRQGLENKQNYLNYFRITKENRLMWGGEARYFYGLSTDLAHDRDGGAFATIEREMRRTFPQLSDVRIEHRWGGPIAVTVKFLPSFGTVPGTGIHFGFGYSGHGVAPTHTGGQILRDLVLGRDTEHTDLLMVQPAKRYPPEPAAFLGERVSRRALKKQDRAMEAGKDVGMFEPWILRVLNRLS
jgi:glycine/D-amino acid oxidase-like deaminating enzyme